MITTGTATSVVGSGATSPEAPAARNVDNSNLLIFKNPETCDRGGYTDFCGYFYAGFSVVIN